MKTHNRASSRFSLPMVAALAGWCLPLAAATPLKDAEVSQPQGTEPVLRLDFSLLEPASVSSVEATVGGKAIEPSKVKFTAAAALPEQRCAILLLVDNTPDMGDYLPHIRLLLQKFADQAETAPFQIGLATFSDDMRVLVPVGGKTADLKSPEKLNQIDGTGPSTEIYLSAQHAIPVLEQTKAARKFLVIISNGRGEDKKYTHDETVAAARAAKVRICTVGYAQPQGDNPSYLQTLTKLSEETGGFKERASVLTRELPADFESSLLKYAVSGGRAEVNLAGLAAPLTVDFKVTADSKKEYVFSHKLDTFAVQAAPGKDPDKGPDKMPDKEPEKKPDDPAKPDKEPDKPGKEPDKQPVQPGDEISSKPVPPSTLFDKIRGQVMRQIKERPNLAAMVGGAALIVLLLLVMVGRRLMKPAPPVALASGPPPAVAPQFVAGDEALPVPVEEPPVLAWLESLDAEQTRHPIRKSAVRIGRKDDNDINLKNDSVSSHHAEIVQRGAQFVISNLAAANGVYINNKRVETSPLAHNDLVELGEVRFRFLVKDSPNSNP